MRTVALFTIVLLGSCGVSAGQGTWCPSSTPYGENARAGHTLSVNGIRLYYETYGRGRPLLLIHGNGGSIASMRCQIVHFVSRYRVIVADNRAHGKTEDGASPLTYEQMADDLSAMLNQTKTGPVDVIGQSDGAILGLLLAIHHPAQVNTLVAFGPNLRPDATVLADWFLPSTKKALDDANDRVTKGDTSANWTRIARQNALMLNEPHIPITDLRRIQAPTLIMGADEDAITLEHYVEIYRALPKGHLAILPGATHFALFQQPEIFNATAERFLRRPFTRPTTKQILGIQ